MMNFDIGFNPNLYYGQDAFGIQNTGAALGIALEEKERSVEASGKTKPAGECQTCKNRKYKDGSDEMVSFKSAAHISPTAAASRVMAHEMEHVSNAYAKAKLGNGKVLQASVALKTAICPECKRAYVCGGVTRTSIAYSNEDEPYQKQLKEFKEEAMKGDGFDRKV